MTSARYVSANVNHSTQSRVFKEELSQVIHHEYKEQRAPYIVAIEAVHCPIQDHNLSGLHALAVHLWTNPSGLVYRIKDATIFTTTTVRLSAWTLGAEITP